MSFEGKSDAEVMAAFYEDHPAAFEEIMRRWEERLLRYFLRHGWPREDAQDLTQEALSRVLTTRKPGRKRFDVTRPFSPWMNRIAANCSAELHEQRRRQPQTTAMEAAEEVEGAAAPIPESVLFKLALFECLDELTEQERYFYDQWKDGLGTKSQTEIARELGVSNSRVTEIKESALSKLRECLTRKGCN